MKHVSLALAALMLGTGLARASEVEDKMYAYVQSEVKAWIVSPTILAAVAAANTAHAGLTPEDITRLDTEWKAEVGSNSTRINAVIDNAASIQLRDEVTKTDGKVSEIIVMDNRGLNAAISDVTSDFWQGDEAKFQETYALGPDAVHISEIEWDDSTQSYQAQISFTLNDPATSEPIGAVTLGMNADAF